MVLCSLCFKKMIICIGLSVFYQCICEQESSAVVYCLILGGLHMIKIFSIIGALQLLLVYFISNNYFIF